jgi:uncharacterized OsmC-like protein
MRAVTDAGGFEIVVDEPEDSGGTNTGPQPTDLLLASLSSCFTLSLVWVAKRRGIELAGLQVNAVAEYQGMKFTRISIAVTADTPREDLEQLIPDAQRICYVTNTLRQQPDLTFTVG